MSSSFEMPFVKKNKVSKDAFTFYFEKDSGFKFNAGEYIRMTLNIKNPDERGSSRYFTIASSPNDPKYLKITTRIIRSSFKKKLIELVAGENVKVFGPLGNFVIDKKDKRERIFLAGGIGVTTFYSMILYEVEVGFSSPITLIVSFSSADEAVFKEEFEKIQRTWDKFKVHYVFTNADGRIDGEKIQKLVPNYRGSVFYIVGPKVMEESLTQVVSSMGVAEENIKTEDFTGY